MKDFERKASSPIDKFLLKNNDPLLVNGLEELKRGQRDRNTEIDWTREKVRHRKYERDFGLGTNRPLTNWREGGVIKVSPAIYQRWLMARPNREKDFLDISFKRGIKRGYDSRFVMYV